MTYYGPSMEPPRRCPNCDGSGKCPDCDGDGLEHRHEYVLDEPCPTCAGEGTCVECDPEAMDVSQFDTLRERDEFYRERDQ